MSKTILVVDDEKRILSLLEAYLEQQGFQVVTALNGKEAIFVARHEKPDLIILDIMMPKMDGIEAMQQIRGDDDLAETPTIIMVSAYSREDALREAGRVKWDGGKPRGLHGVAMRGKPIAETVT